MSAFGLPKYPDLEKYAHRKRRETDSFTLSLFLHACIVANEEEFALLRPALEALRRQQPLKELEVRSDDGPNALASA